MKCLIIKLFGEQINRVKRPSPIIFCMLSTSHISACVHWLNTPESIDPPKEMNDFNCINDFIVRWRLTRHYTLYSALATTSSSSSFSIYAQLTDTDTNTNACTRFWRYEMNSPWMQKWPIEKCDASIADRNEIMLDQQFIFWQVENEFLTFSYFFTSLFPDNPLTYTFSTILSIFSSFCRSENWIVTELI